MTGFFVHYITRLKKCLCCNVKAVVENLLPSSLVGVGRIQFLSVMGLRFCFLSDC